MNGAFCPAKRFVALFAVFAIIVSVFLEPIPAFADKNPDSGEYSIEEATFTADIRTDGSLHVVERRIMRFEKDHTALCWWINLPGGDSLESIGGVSVAQLASPDQQEVQLVPLEYAEYDPDWRDGKVPEGDIYSFDPEHGRTYAFFDVAGEYVLMQVEYDIQGAVQLYKDCAELRWKFVDAGQWSCASKNVSCSFSFPVPAETMPVAGQDVYAWSHGPEGGGLSFDSGVNSVSVWEEAVSADEYAEIRIMLPSEWISNPTPEVQAKHAGGMRRDSILQDELEWVDHGAYRRLSELSSFIVFAVLSIALVAAALVLYALYGRSRGPQPPRGGSPIAFAEGASPAAVSRLWRWNRMSPQDFAACVMGLEAKGAVRFGVQQESGLYYLVDTGACGRDALDEPEALAVDIIFNDVGGGSRSVWLDDIAAACGQSPEALSYRFDAWHLKLDDQVARLGYFEQRGLFWQRACVVAAAGYFLVAAVVSLALKSPWPAVLALASCVAVMFVASQMGRRSVRGSADYAACQHLRALLAALPPQGADAEGDGSEGGILQAEGAEASGAAEGESACAAVACEDPAAELEGLSLQEWKLLAACAYALECRDDGLAAVGRFLPEEVASGRAREEEDASYVPWFGAYEERGESLCACEQLERAVALVFQQASWKEQCKRAKQQKESAAGRLKACGRKVLYTFRSFISSEKRES